MQKSRTNHFVICYDVPSDKRRRHLSRKLLNYGVRVQFSVFEATLTEEQFERLKKDSLNTLNLELDSLKIYRLPSLTESRVLEFGKVKTYEQHEVQIF